MKLHFVYLSLVLLVTRICIAQSPDQDFINLVTSEVSRIDFDKIETRHSIRILLGIAESCDDLNKPELAQTFLNQAEEIADEEKNKGYVYSLFTTALTLKDLSKAERIAKGAGELKNGFLDRVDMERFKRGDTDAMKNVPRAKLDFFAGYRLAKAYIEVQDFEGAEKFAKNMDIPHEENDPRYIVGYIYREIAKIHRERGDMKLAKAYINKAMKEAGNLYYSGFGIKVIKRSIYGELTKDLDNFAMLAARHPDHQGRELMMSLSSELIRQGHFAEVRRISKLLEEEDDKATVIKGIAIAQTKAGNYEEAKKTIESLSQPEVKSIARMAVAQVMWESGEKEHAAKLIDLEYKALQVQKWDDLHNEQHQKLAGLLGQTKRFEDFKKLLDKQSLPLHRSYCLVSGLKGIARASAK